MAKSFTKYIGKNSVDSHQISPHWLVTFTRFNNRDTQNYTDGEINNIKSDVRKPLIVENDCISISVGMSKSNKNPNATIVLASGDLNYSTAVAVGDFVMINMVNSSEKARELRDRAGKIKPINRIGDGFKGVFKINSVNKIIQTNPSTGVKTVRYQVTAYGFTEFNNSIYYNPTLGKSIPKDVLNYLISADLLEVLSSKKNIQKVLEILPLVILGLGIKQDEAPINSIKKPPYSIPKTVFDLMGLDGKFAIDLYRVMVGIWDNPINPIKTGSNKPEPSPEAIKKGTSPKTKGSKSIQKTTKELQGRIPIQTSSLVNVSLYDLIKRFSNEMVNEMYSCFRIDQETGSILPKLIIRQKPFNTEHGIRDDKGKYKQIEGTKFLSLPRWKISADLIYNLNISKNESLRFNFVHIIGTTGNSSLDDTLMATQNATGSTVRFDKKDINRHGLRPYTRVSNFDWPEGKEKFGKGKVGYASHWADLMFDWINGGHLKANGKISTIGIEDDICVGDNLELQDTVYHIESIQHVGAISPDGRKNFRTNISLTHGVDKRSNVNGPVYPEMDYTDTLLDRQHDYDENYGIMPGFSDTQDIRGRSDGEEVKETSNAKYTPYKLRQKSVNDDKDKN